MIVYVAASSKEAGRASAAMTHLRAVGHEVASDWTRQIQNFADPNLGIPAGAARAISREAFDHIRRSDVLWLLWPKLPTIGAWIETGGFIMAHRQGVGRLVVSGGDPELSIFTNGCTNRTFPTDGAAAAWFADLPPVSFKSEVL